MRKLNTLFLVSVLLVSVAVLATASEPFALEELHLIHWEDVPEGKPSYTGPVSAAVLMAWYAEHGYPELLPDLNGDGRIDEEDTILLAREFGEQMGGTTIDEQLADPFIAYPLARYIAERYPNEFRMLIYDESFPEEVSRDLGQAFNPTEIPGIVLEVFEDPFYELYVQHLEARRPGIVGIGPDVPEWNHFAVSRSFVPAEEPEGWPVDLVSTSYQQFAPEPVWNTFLRLEPERWGFLMPEWTPFEILIILMPEDEAFGAPGQPGDGPGDDPGGDPGDGPGDDPGGDPGGGDQPRYPGQPGGDPGGGPGGDPGVPPGTGDDGACCLPSGSCDTTTAGPCERLGGVFTIGGSCETVDCRQPADIPCAAVTGEITDICYTYESGVLKVYASYAIHNYGPVTANDITAYALVGLNDGINGLGGKPDSQDWKYGIDIPAGGTYAYDVVFTATAPNLDLNNLTYLYGMLWLQVEAPWACWPITKQAFVQTWDPAPLCYPTDDGGPGTPPGGSDDGQPTGSVADVQISMKMVVPESEPAAPGSQIQYNLDVWQAGPATAKNVIVELTIPSNATVNATSGSAVQTAHRPPNDVLRWNLGDLVTFPPGTGLWLQVDVDEDACGTIQYDFSVTTDTTDPDLSNNSGSLTTQIGPCDGSTGTPPGGQDDGGPTGGEPSGGYDSTIPGACCLPTGSCDSLSEAECLRLDGLFYGPGTDCGEIRCLPHEDPPCAVLRSRVTNACQLYQGPDQPMIVKADFELQNPGDKDARDVVVKLIAGVPLLSNLQTTYNETYIFTIPVIPAGGSHQFSHTFSINPAPPQRPTGDTVVMVFAASMSPLCKLKVNSIADLFHLLYFGPSENLCPEDEGTPPGGEGDIPGACCLPNGGCETATSGECDRQGGQFQGARTSCEGVSCEGSGEPDPDPEPDPEPDPGPGALPNLWVTGMTGCWSWSGDGQEHVIATITGVVHNGGQANASNVRATVTAGGKSTNVTVGSIAAGGQKTVSATIDVGAYDQVSWTVSTSIEADPYNAITEADESNNTTNSSFPESSDCN